jgi:hypothetical protein
MTKKTFEPNFKDSWGTNSLFTFRVNNATNAGPDLSKGRPGKVPKAYEEKRAYEGQN